MGSIYPRGNKLWLAFVGNDGRRRCKSSGYEIGKEAEAKKLLRRVESRVAAARTLAPTLGRAPRVRDFAKQWTARRRKTIRDWKSDEGRLDLHMLPRLGSLRLADVQPRHIDKFVYELRTETDLAPHTIRNVYALTKALFRDAAISGHLESNPCILTSTHLGSDEYKDPLAQARCRYNKLQLSKLIYAEEVDLEGRLMAALGGLAGCRLGEIAGLRWSDIEFDATPLPRMTIARSYENATTKTKRIRFVPVHPALSEILASWRATGWERHVGRPPSPKCPLLPRSSCSRTPGEPHSKKSGAQVMHRALDALSIEKPIKITHALRSTFISLALESGADHYLIERISHTASQGRRAFDVYAKPNWDALCREVSKISL